MTKNLAAVVRRRSIERTDAVCDRNVHARDERVCGLCARARDAGGSRVHVRGACILRAASAA
ncbi:hypothetical protein [Burkholderia pseudomallei]|uniref:hypothetical protein n=1 Tax=Burkholderia pseudomallei TaxID=28450 RepID=UPI0009B2871E|nr:hypothetical protein [Burkholderia pseudomallei]